MTAELEMAGEEDLTLRMSNGGCNDTRVNNNKMFKFL